MKQDNQTASIVYPDGSQETFNLLELGTMLVNSAKDGNYRPTMMAVRAIVTLKDREKTHVQEYCDHALRLSAKKGHHDIVDLLIEHGANPHTENDYPLCISSKKGHLKVVEVLLKYGADIHADNEEALIGAIEQDHMEIVKLLISHGANQHVKQDWPLIRSAINGNLNLVQYLVTECGCDANLVVKDSLIQMHILDWCRKYVSADELRQNLADNLPMQQNQSIQTKI